MAEPTRKDLVLRYLQKHANEWVDGPDIANAAVGGSEGLKRVRELRQEGHRIITRPHPDRKRDIFQYKLVPPESLHPVIQERLPVYQDVIRTPPKPTAPVEAPQPLTPAGRPFLIRRNENGEIELTKEVCVECGGMYDDDLEHRTTDIKHLRWMEDEQKRTAGQMTIGVPEQPPPYRFTSMPKKVDMATMTICPRCHGKRRMGRSFFSRKKGGVVETPSEDFTRDPFKPTVKGEPNPCQRCGGFGIVPTHVDNSDSVSPLRQDQSS